MFVRGLALWAALAAVTMETSAEEGSNFRVTTRVFVGESVQPAGENTTLFLGGVVYDFMETGSREVTVFDSQTGDFDLIDPALKARTSLSLEELRRFVAELKVRTASHEGLDQVVRFAANPKFDSSYDAERRELVLQSPAMTYRASGMAVADDEADQYHHFCDSFCQLNSTRPGALPPFARLQLNRQLAAQGVVPREIRLTLAARQPGGAKTRLRSEHHFSGSLTDADRQRITQAHVQRSEFAPVAFHEYRRLQVTAARPQARR